MVGGGVAYAAQNSQTQCIEDGSLSVKTCLNIQWNDAYSGGTHYVELVKVQAKVTQLDPTVQASELAVGAVVDGRCLSGCGVESDGALIKDKSLPAWGTFYGGAPPWSQTFVSVAAGGALYNCAVFQTFLKRGSTSWNYTGDWCEGSAPDVLSISDRERGLH
jgi:hypothetical protein